MADNYVFVDSSGTRYRANVGGVTVSRSYKVEYNSAGTYSWLAPAGVTSVNVEVAGAGGGYGWNCDCDCNCNCGGDDS